MNARIEPAAYASLRKSVAETMIGSPAMLARMGTDVSALKAQRAHERNLIAANHWAMAPLRLMDIDGAMLAVRWLRRYRACRPDAAAALQVAA